VDLVLPSEENCRDIYLDLIKRCLLDLIYLRPEPPEELPFGWPAFAHTMIGAPRLNNVQFCVESVIADDVPGDLIETGVWRGGTTIFMRALLKAHGVTDRRVWVADSFAGLPPPNVAEYPSDAGLDLYTYSELAIPLEEVRGNFERYGLLDEQVRFVKGWFRDTLPNAPIEELAVVRLDGDLYESTMDGLVNLYPKLSPGGYCIIDDYGHIDACRKAVDDYRDAHDIDETILEIDGAGSYWRRDARPERPAPTRPRSARARAPLSGEPHPPGAACAVAGCTAVSTHRRM
jgi:hypothetical protein